MIHRASLELPGSPRFSTDRHHLSSVLLPYITPSLLHRARSRLRRRPLLSLMQRSSLVIASLRPSACCEPLNEERTLNLFYVAARSAYLPLSDSSCDFACFRMYSPHFCREAVPGNFIESFGRWECLHPEHVRLSMGWVSRVRFFPALAGSRRSSRRSTRHGVFRR